MQHIILRNQNTAEEVIIKTTYDYQKTGIQKNEYNRSTGSALFSNQFYSHNRFEIPLIFVTSSDYSKLKTWFENRSHLKYTENNLEIPVLSGFDVKLTEFSLNNFSNNYSRVYKEGLIVLEGF